MSTAIIIGRTGRDPELRFTESGLAMTRLSVASNRRKKKGDEWEDETTWYDVTAFGDLAENIAESVNKGDEIIAEGYVQQPKAFVKKDGETGVSLPFVAQNFGISLRWSVLQSKPSSRGNGQSRVPQQQQRSKPAYDASEDPF